MTSSIQYFINTGKKDYHRLAIVNRLYNPGSLQFLEQMGLKPGMKVLEVGCGTGHMACEIARKISPTGRVIASDGSAEQLAIAKEMAHRENIHNMEFIQLDLNQGLLELHNQFDFIFGRWVLEFTAHAEQTLIDLFNCLKPGGVLVYEGSDIRDPGCFSYPHASVIQQYCDYGVKICELNKMELDFIKKCPFYLKKYQSMSLKTAINHPMMQTSEEKMPFRLVFESSKSFVLEHQLLSDKEYDDIIQGLIAFEQADNIAGYYRNIMVAATKSLNSD